MPTAVTRISIQSDLSQIADRFELSKAGVDGFETAVPNQPVEILVGYKGQHLHQLTGEADEWELQWTEKSLTGVKRGRDLGARLLERPFRKTYFRFQPNPVPTTPYAVGTFTAQQIVSEIAAEVGLSLEWSAPDYTIQEETLAFTSSAGDAVKRFTSVMGQPEMFTIDVYTVGTVLTVRQRVPAPTLADYALSMADLMGVTATRKKRPGPLYGTVTITGGSSGGAIVIPPEDLPEEIEITEVNETPPGWPNKGKSRTTTTKRILQSIANEVFLRETSVTELEQGEILGGAFQRVAETRKTVEYDDDLLLDNQGRINLPVKMQESTTTWGFGASLYDWREVRREGTSYAYNDDLDLIVQDTLIEELVGAAEHTDQTGVKTSTGGDLMPTERRIVRNQRIDANQYQITTEVFEIATTKSGVTGKLEIDPVMRLVATNIHVTRGQLPGPQRIRRPRQVPPGGGSPSGRVLREVTISSDPDAVNVTISDSNLTEALADQLIAQFTTASGKWRHEVTLRHVALPFLTKGKVLGSVDALPLLGAPLPNALIVSRRMDYDESGDSPSFQADLTLAWWA